MQRMMLSRWTCCSPEVAHAGDVLAELLLGQTKVGHLDARSGKACVT